MRNDTPRGILKKVAAADCDLVKTPILTPHFEFHPIDGQQVLLVSETFNTLLHGSIHADLLPLLDGRSSRQDITDALAPAYPASDVEKALVFLTSKGYAVSGEYDMERGPAAFWSSLGASPCRAEERLGESRVAVVGDDGRLAGRLSEMGVSPGPDNPTLYVAVCDDYLDERYGTLNRRHMESGIPWMLVRPKGVQPLFGPVFRPAQQGPCWACLAYRLRGHQEVHNFLRNYAGDDAAFKPRADETVILDAVYGLVAAEIAKWLVLEEMASLHENAISLDMVQLNSECHSIMRRPQCFACGDEELYRADRPAVPVRLRPSPKSVINSGGVRAVPPEETLARYNHLVSPVSGVVTWVRRTTEDADAWLHVYWSGTNFALKSSRLSSLRRSLRSKCVGKGSTPQQSRASALCEAVERYSNAFHGDEIRCRRRFSDFVEADEAEAIHPNQVQLFSDRQLDNAEQINGRGHPYNIVPPRFDPDAEIDWSPVWSLTREQHRYLPTSMLYSIPEEYRGRSDLIADSNGCAAGNTLEEAILQGFFELVERDAFAIWWYNRLLLPGVDLESFDDKYLAFATEYYRNYQRDLWLLDATSDLGIPTFIAISRRIDRGAEDIIYGAGTHTDPHIAALRAVCELNQVLNWIQGSGKGGAGHDINDPLSRWWWDTVKLADHPYLAPVSGAALRCRSDYPVPETADVMEDVERSRSLVEAKGMEFLVLDQTRPDIGMPVVRVIVPGLRHFWERFAPGRLYEVPVEMRRRESPLLEAEFNPVPVIT
ncbi:MAG: TOMM precursor leader peptide-binding protein [Gammaproteobacteria bacterium]|nr:TOMM precursor leader peptide-binding protein [Gammaproteobacteria bacterium]